MKSGRGTLPLIFYGSQCMGVGQRGMCAALALFAVTTSWRVFLQVACDAKYVSGQEIRTAMELV